MNEHKLTKKEEQGQKIVLSYLLISILLLVYRIMITNKISDIGNSHFAILYEILSIFYLFFLFTMPQIISRMVDLRTKKGQFQNAHRVFQISRKFLFLGGLFMSVLIFFASEIIAKTFFIMPKAQVALQLSAPMFLLMGIMGVYRGYFQGINTLKPTLISKIILSSSVFLLTILFTSLFMNYGTKVAALLQSTNYKYLYGILGIIISLFLGFLCSCFFLVFLYRLYKKTYEKQMLRDRTTIHEPYRMILHNLFILHIPCLMIYIIYPIVNLSAQVIFNHHANKEGTLSQGLVAFGEYSGKSGVLISFPIYLLVSLSLFLEPKVKEKLDLNQLARLRDRISIVLKYSFLFSLFFTVLYISLADVILQVLFHEGSKSAVSQLQFGGLLVIVLGLSVISSALLCSMERCKRVMIHQFIAFICYLLLMIFSIGNMPSAIDSILLAKFTFAIVLLLLNIFVLRKDMRLKQEFLTVYLVPIVLAIITGLLLTGFKLLLQILNLPILTFIILFVVGFFVFFILLCVMKVVTEKDLRKLPFLDGFISILKKGHLLP